MPRYGKTRVEHEYRVFYGMDFRNDGKFLLNIRASIYRYEQGEIDGSIVLYDKDKNIIDRLPFPIEARHYDFGHHEVIMTGIHITNGRKCRVGIPLVFETFEEMAKIRHIKIEWTDGDKILVSYKSIDFETPLNNDGVYVVVCEDRFLDINKINELDDSELGRCETLSSLDFAELDFKESIARHNKYNDFWEILGTPVFIYKEFPLLHSDSECQEFFNFTDKCGFDFFDLLLNPFEKVYLQIQKSSEIVKPIGEVPNEY
jgi:hypothetical protein